MRWRCSTPAAARCSPPPGGAPSVERLGAPLIAAARDRARAARRARDAARTGERRLAVGDGAVAFREVLERSGAVDSGRRLGAAPGHARSTTAGWRPGCSRAPRTTSRRSTSALPDAELARRAGTASDDMTDRQLHDPPARLLRPAAGDRDRAPGVPDAVVAGDVRAGAVEAVGHLPGGDPTDGALRRVPDLLALRHRLAPDEHRRRPAPAAARDRAGAAGAR